MSAPATTSTAAAPSSPASRRARQTERPASSADEIFYVVAGTGRAHVGDEEAVVRAGDLAVVPEMAPHGVANTGEDTLKVVGVFSAAHVTSTFEAPWSRGAWP